MSYHTILLLFLLGLTCATGSTFYRRCREYFCCNNNSLVQFTRNSLFSLFCHINTSHVREYLHIQYIAVNLKMLVETWLPHSPLGFLSSEGVRDTKILNVQLNNCSGERCNFKLNETLKLTINFEASEFVCVCVCVCFVWFHWPNATMKLSCFLFKSWRIWLQKSRCASRFSDICSTKSSRRSWFLSTSRLSKITVHTEM